MPIHLEALVLQYPLDSCVFPVRRKLCLEYHAKGAVANNLALRILDLFRLASKTILDLFSDHLYA